MFYVANVIKFSALSDLLRKSTILVRYKVNSFRPPRVNQIDIRALLLVFLSSNGYKIDVIYEKKFTVPDSVPSEVTQSWNQDPPLELSEPELINQGEIQVWVESRTGNVAMGGGVSQMFVAPTVLED